MTDPRFLTAVPKDAPDFTDDYERIQLADEPADPLPRRVTLILLAGFVVAGVVGVWVANH